MLRPCCSGQCKKLLLGFERSQKDTVCQKCSGPTHSPPCRAQTLELQMFFLQKGRFIRQCEAILIFPHTRRARQYQTCPKQGEAKLNQGKPKNKQKTREGKQKLLSACLLHMFGFLRQILPPSKPLRGRAPGLWPQLVLEAAVWVGAALQHTLHVRVEAFAQQALPQAGGQSILARQKKTRQNKASLDMPNIQTPPTPTAPLPHCPNNLIELKL